MVSKNNHSTNYDLPLVPLIFLVPPEVEVTATHLRVNLGGSTTLFCNVTRTNPSISGTFMWVNERIREQVSEDSDTLLLKLSSMEDFATYSCTVKNDAGATGSGIVTIEHGCKHNDGGLMHVNHIPYDRFVAR